VSQDAPLALARLLRLASPGLPVGAYGYSQGLETAVQLGWVRDEASIGAWIGDVLACNLATFEAPLLLRLYAAWCDDDLATVARLNEYLLAGRETAEFRAETCQTGYALRALFEATGEFPAVQRAALRSIEAPAFASVFAFAAARWQIAAAAMLSGYLFAWAENQVNAAMRTMRIGHVAAQRILSDVSTRLPALVEQARARGDATLSNFAPALAIASCLHETHDGRMFRS
jgi:urease accessory protein